ncbi:MAG: response regulator transcription factor [Chitinophagales bacterium]|nr:response regulator transcription factor [Chitinophagales bacterium]MDW8392704.1 response regulator transcription factor [Chitinophagales bacterium]
MSTRILLVEDEPVLADSLRISLQLEGYEVVVARTGPDAVRQSREQRFDLAILDVMLPDMDGFAVCSAIRNSGNRVPVLFLTVKNSSSDKVRGFQMGADDYLTKPFHLDELLLRIKALLRRTRPATSGTPQDVFCFGENEINFSTFTARNRHRQEIRLTQREASLLRLLVDRRNEVVSRKEILETVWGYDVLPTTRTIDNFIVNFRKYFEEDARRPRYFQSVRGVGYRLVAEELPEE